MFKFNLFLVKLHVDNMNGQALSDIVFEFERNSWGDFIKKFNADRELRGYPDKLIDDTTTKFAQATAVMKAIKDKAHKEYL